MLFNDGKQYAANAGQADKLVACHSIICFVSSVQAGSVTEMITLDLWTAVKRIGMALGWVSCMHAGNCKRSTNVDLFAVHAALLVTPS